MPGAFERFYPAIVAAVAAATCYAWGRPDALTDPEGSIFVGAVAAVAIGFTGTALTVLIALEDKPIIGWLRRAGENHYDRLLGYMKAALYWWFGALGVACLPLLFDLSGVDPRLVRAESLVTIAIMAGGMAAWFRVSSLVIRLLRGEAALSSRRLHPEDPTSEGIQRPELRSIGKR